MNFIPSKFSLNGHQTFPMRYGWLEKICINLIDKYQLDTFNIDLIRHEELITNYGLGKNMAESLRFWLKSCDIIEMNFSTKTAKFTPFALSIFGNNGSDPYLENIETIWYLHWKIIQNNHLNFTWYWYFNHFTISNFDRSHLVEEILSTIGKVKADITSQQSVKRDVDCFVRSYLTTSNNSKSSEDILECPFAELNLFSIGLGGSIQAPRLPRKDFPISLIILSIKKVWENLGGNINTLNIETLLDTPFSPGRCFLMNRESLLEKLEMIEKITDGNLILDTSAGLYQVMIKNPQIFKNIINQDTLKLLEEVKN